MFKITGALNRGKQIHMARQAPATRGKPKVKQKSPELDPYLGFVSAPLLLPPSCTACSAKRGLGCWFWSPEMLLHQTRTQNRYKLGPASSPLHPLQPEIMQQA